MISLTLNSAEKVYLEYHMPKSIQVLQDTYKATFDTSSVQVKEPDSQQEADELQEFIRNISESFKSKSLNHLSIC